MQKVLQNELKGEHGVPLLTTGVFLIKSYVLQFFVFFLSLPVTESFHKCYGI